MKKTITVILLVIFSMAGCSPVKYPDHDPEKRLASKPALMEGLQESVKEAKEKQNKDITEKRDEDIHELNILHRTAELNKARNNSSYYDTVSINLVTVEDIEQSMEVLVKLGYLAEKTDNEDLFKQALLAYQNDRDLPASGKLDADTLASIRQE